MHKHVCLYCDVVWGCSDDACGTEEHVTFLACFACEHIRKENGMSNGIHMHHCPKCGRGWDCANECGGMAGEGTLSQMICMPCTDYVVGLSKKPESKNPWWAVSSSASKSTLTTHVPVVVRQGIIHAHKCMICEHAWEHDDVDCAFEEMINLECPGCFLFKGLCPGCSGQGVEKPELARSDKELAYVCQRCNLIFREDLHHDAVS